MFGTVAAVRGTAAAAPSGAAGHILVKFRDDGAAAGVLRQHGLSEGPDVKPDADLDAVEAWSLTTGAGIKVAVLDSGVDGNREDISSKVVARANFSSSVTESGDVVAEDYYGHGTHMAGKGAKVINMSLGVRASRTLETAVNSAWNKGVVLVAAAGNGGNRTKSRTAPAREAPMRAAHRQKSSRRR